MPLLCISSVSFLKILKVEGGDREATGKSSFAIELHSGHTIWHISGLTHGDQTLGTWST